MSSHERAPAALWCGRDLIVRYGGVEALRGVEFAVYPGEIHGVVGCNGAGKSTLMKVLSGAVSPSQGEIHWQGKPVSWRDPREALAHGVAMVYQELSGFPALSLAENIFLGQPPRTPWGTIDWHRLGQEAASLLQRLGVERPVWQRWQDQTLSVRQMSEIARALQRGARLLIFDEPTSALSLPEARRLFGVMRELKSHGVAQVLISHFLEEVLAVSDRITVLRDGRVAATRPVSAWDKSSLVAAMLGTPTADLTTDQPRTLPAKRSSDPILEVRRWTLPGVCEQVSLSVSAGECVGLYGYVGAGHLEFVQSLVGRGAVSSGELLVRGKPIPSVTPAHARALGFVYVPADRGWSVVPRRTVRENVTLAHLRCLLGPWIDRRREQQCVHPLLERVGCQPAQPECRAAQLSGGNQQKVVLARWLAGPVSVFLLEEPTRGIDIQGKRDVMQLIQAEQARGASVLLASTEPELVLEYADRILVFSRGHIVREFCGEKVSQADLIHAAEPGVESDVG
ncbi:MAG: ABC transporter ATP-binding protein [Planctomycetaceae bacterium]|nr:MAG: ABC transporter ATP-binding protein [Planctomycetaceae bacterium]